MSTRPILDRNKEIESRIELAVSEVLKDIGLKKFHLTDSDKKLEVKGVELKNGGILCFPQDFKGFLKNEK